MRMEENMKPIINFILELIGKGLIKLPDIDDDKFDKFADRLAKVSEATAPTVKAITAGLTEGGAKSITDSIGG